MKLTLLACILAPALFFAQNGAYKPSVIIYYATLDNKPYTTRLLLVYNEQGLISDSTWQKQEKGKWLDQEKYSKKYENGKLTEEIIGALYDKKWVNNKTAYTYTPEGKLAVTSEWEEANGGWREISRLELLYDADGYPRSSVKSAISASGELKVKESKAFIYNKGVLEYESTMDEKGQSIKRINIKYNDMMKPVEAVTKERMSDLEGLTPTFKSTAKYDNSGFMTDSCSYQIDEYVPDQWDIYEHYGYTRDAKGNILTETRDSLDLGAQPTKVEYTYSDSGVLTSSSSYIYNGEEWLRQHRMTYTYDAAGNVLSEEETGWNTDLNAVEYIYITNYSYNDKGSIVSETRDNKNFKTGKITPDYKHTYVYDEHNNCVTMESVKWEAKKKKWVNNETVFPGDGNYAYKIEKTYIPATK